MPNIKLSSLVNSLSSKNSSSLASLANYEEKLNTIFKDIKLDFSGTSENNAIRQIVHQSDPINSLASQQDIEVSVNENAIINSLKNWFWTSKYSRLLNPELNFNFRSYLFERLDEHTAFFLASEIINTLPAYEPRINVEQCDIVVDYENSAYIITLKVTIPALNNKEVNFKEILSSTGYILD